MTETASVELIPIKSETKTIQACFRQCLYEVPNFQRDYSWSSDQLTDFWNDVVLAGGDFFFGSTVTWVSQRRELFNDTYSIVDGQQRLTTSAIMLSVVRDAFYDVAARSAGDDSIEEVARSQGATTQRYLIATDDDGNSYPILKRSEKMFYERIQNPSAIPSDAKWTGSAESLWIARRFFEDRLLEDLGVRTLPEQIELLKSVRANVLKARVIQVELTSEEDGFLIFETLNTRGADLRLSDLVKNLLIRGGAKDVLDRQAVSDKWVRLVDRVQEGRSSPDVVDRFIWQSWNSRRPAVKEPELFKEITRRVAGDPTSHIALLEELVADSLTYEWLEYEDVQVMAKGDGGGNAFAVPEFVDSVRALAIWNVSVANSTVLAIARKFNATDLVTDRQLIETMRLVENFHFQFTALTNSGSTGGTRARYNRFAVMMEAAGSKAEVAAAILDLRTKLTASLPPREQAEKAFRELFYAPTLKLPQAQKARARKVFIAYVLMSFAKAEKILTAGQDLARWSIEHIRPQALGSENLRDRTYSIGNLALLTSSMNSSIGNVHLSQKLEALRAGAVFFDQELASWVGSDASNPTDQQIERRAQVLAAHALDKVWAL